MSHPKIKSLRESALPITYSTLMVRADGKLTTEDRIIRGYAAVWGVIDSYRTYWIRGAFAKSIQDRGPDSQSKYKIVMLWQHDRRDPIGRITVLREDDYGLYFEAEIDEVPSGDRALKQVRSGTINQFSFGFDYVWDKLDYNEELDAIGVREVELFEISPVTMGANPETFAYRSPEQHAALLEELNSETEDFIRSIPRQQQLELRQLIARHISLRTEKPQELRHNALRGGEPEATGVDYKYLIDNLKLF